MIRQDRPSNHSFDTFGAFGRSLRALTAMALAVVLVAPAYAGTPTPAAATALASLEAATGGDLQYTVSGVTGNIDFVRATNGALLALDNATASPEARALTFLDAHADLFGIAALETAPLSGLLEAHPEFDLDEVTVDHLGQTHVRLNQRQDGLEVFGAQLVVHMNELGITGVNGTFIQGIDAGGAAPVLAQDAAALALEAAKGAVDVKANEPMIYPKGLFEGQLDEARLAWSVRVSGPNVAERVFIDAINGETLAQISERHEALDRVVYSPDYDPNDPNANVQRREGDPPSALPPVNNLYDFAGEVYHLFDNGFGRDSYDGAGSTMRSVYLVNNVCPNAYWNSTSTNYCPGFDTDDIVAHEWGHAYTEHTHGLIYSYQSGALNESYSDIFGEIADLNNAFDGVGGSNNADPYPDGQRWIIGEDLVGPAQNSLLTRDMWEPDRLASPGKVTSSNYACGEADGGGVHTNSGVPNHAFAMLVDGKSYNGQSIGGIGFNRAAHIYYRAMSVYQVPSTNFANHADSLMASCEDLRDFGVILDDLFTGAPSGEVVTQSDCDQVAKAIVAVEMRTPPTQCGYVPMLDPNTPPLCDGASTIFDDDFESGLGSWTLASNGVNPEWPNFNWTAEGSLPEERAGSAAFAVDSRGGTCAPGGDISGTFNLDSPVITIPAGATNAQVRFDHYVETELEYDGGNLLVSVNGGAFELVPAASYLFNGPNAALASTADGNTNPKAGEDAWHGADGGEVTGSWGTTIINLDGVAAAGDTVELRYDFGVDGCNGVTGWYVDNVHAYTCEGDGLPNPPAAPEQQPIADDATPDQEGGVDRDGDYTVSWTYPEDAEEPCGFRVEEATAFGNLFFDDAEELLAAGANSTFAGDLEWHTEPHPDSGSNGYTAIYHDLSAPTLTQVLSIDLPAGQSSVLSYDSFEDIEDGYDEGIVSISVDGGPLELVERFTGNFSGRRELDLSAWVGESVQIAFTLSADIYFSFPLYQGWFIDNISIDSANWTSVGTVSGAERELDLTDRPDGTNYYRVVGLFRDCEDPLEGPISNEQSIEVARVGVETFPPSASFTATPNPAEVGESVAFDGSASSDNDAEGPGPEIVEYYWSFGDGATETTANPSTSHSYAAAGTYRVVLRVTDNDGETAFDETFVEVEEGQQSGDHGKVTGGGHIMVDGRKANFGFNAKSEAGILTGNLQFQDKANGVKIKANSVSELSIDGTQASFTAPCSVNKVDGFTCTVDVTDNGEPGSADTFSIQASSGYSAAGTLSGGNIQVH